MHSLQATVSQALRQAFRESVGQHCEPAGDTEAQLVALHEAGRDLLQYLQAAPIPAHPTTGADDQRSLLLYQLQAALGDVRSARLNG